MQTAEYKYGFKALKPSRLFFLSLSSLTYPLPLLPLHPSLPPPLPLSLSPFLFPSSPTLTPSPAPYPLSLFSPSISPSSPPFLPVPHSLSPFPLSSPSQSAVNATFKAFYMYIAQKGAFSLHDVSSAPIAKRRKESKSPVKLHSTEDVDLPVESKQRPSRLNLKH